MNGMAFPPTQYCCPPFFSLLMDGHGLCGVVDVVIRGSYRNGKERKESNCRLIKYNQLSHFIYQVTIISLNISH